MTRQEFESGMKHLAALFPDRLPNEIQRQDYFEFIEFFRANDFEKAIKHLMLIYKWKNFPALSEIRAALEFILNEDNPSYATAEELARSWETTYCQTCNNTGYELFEKQNDETPRWANTTARPCTCAAGKKRAEGLRQYFLKLRYKRRLAQVRPEQEEGR
jgi:hypothetical protein